MIKKIQVFSLKTIVLFASMLLAFSQLNAQDLKLRSSVGFAGYGTPIDGYYFSFDLGIPIVNGLEIDPSFTFCSNITSKEIFYRMDRGYVQSDINESLNGKLAGYFQVFLNINPFQWSNNENLNKTDFGIGVGYGFKAMSHYYYSYNNNEVISLIAEHGISKTIPVKLFYNYHVNKYYFGIVLGVQDVLDEAPSIIGIQFGINVN